MWVYGWRKQVNSRENGTITQTFNNNFTTVTVDIMTNDWHVDRDFNADVISFE